VEEAEDREWRRKRMGLTWRARQREGQRKRADAKARGRGGRGREGRGPGVEVQEGGQRGYAKPEHRYGGMQRADMEACKGKSQMSREQSKKREGTERRQRAEQKR